MPDNFQPSVKFISSVSNAERAIITCTADHGFENGSWVRVRIPDAYGMEINAVTKVNVITSDTIETNLFTLYDLPFVPLVYPPAFTSAQVIPISQAVDNIGI